MSALSVEPFPPEVPPDVPPVGGLGLVVGLEQPQAAAARMQAAVRIRIRTVLPLFHLMRIAARFLSSFGKGEETMRRQQLIDEARDRLKWRGQGRRIKRSVTFLTENDLSGF
jgi:hypothetical protein